MFISQYQHTGQQEYSRRILHWCGHSEREDTFMKKGNLEGSHCKTTYIISHPIWLSIYWTQIPLNRIPIITWVGTSITAQKGRDDRMNRGSWRREERDDCIRFCKETELTEDHVHTHTQICMWLHAKRFILRNWLTCLWGWQVWNL